MGWLMSLIIFMVCVQVKIKEHEADSGVYEDLSSFQLTTADSECVLLYTVNTTHCIHYCDSDTCL